MKLPFNSFTLSKLRQRQMLEEKLSERRKRKMAQLEQRQAQEVRVRQLKLHLVPSWRQYSF